MNKKDNIVLVGDIHGEFNKLRYDIRERHRDAYIIQVGDFGVGFHKPNYYKNEAFPRLNETLLNKNCHLYVIRGNHDDPSWFQTTNNPFGFENITLLQDYSHLNLLGHSVLLVGGAVSVDRRFRHEGKSWWSGEEVNLKLEHQFPYKQQYDLVVTHTRPRVCGAFKGFSNIQYWCDQDYDLKNDLIEEGHKLDYIYERTKPKRWVYGHFHESCNSIHEETAFKCLNIDEHWQFYV